MSRVVPRPDSAPYSACVRPCSARHSRRVGLTRQPARLFRAVQASISRAPSAAAAILRAARAVRRGRLDTGLAVQDSTFGGMRVSCSRPARPGVREYSRECVRSRRPSPGARRAAVHALRDGADGVQMQLQMQLQSRGPAREPAFAMGEEARAPPRAARGRSAGLPCVEYASRLASRAEWRPRLATGSKNSAILYCLAGSARPLISGESCEHHRGPRRLLRDGTSLESPPNAACLSRLTKPKACTGSTGRSAAGAGRVHYMIPLPRSRRTGRRRVACRTRHGRLRQGILAAVRCIIHRARGALAPSAALSVADSRSIAVDSRRSVGCKANKSSWPRARNFMRTKSSWVILLGLVVVSSSAGGTP